MKENSKFGNNLVISIVVILIVIYGSFVFLVHKNPSLFNNQLVASLVKPPVLKMTSEKLFFSIQGEVQRLAFRFEKPIVDASIIKITNQSFEQRKLYRLEYSEDNYWLIIKSATEDRKTLNNAIISMEISNNKIGNKSPIFVDEISVNSKNISAVKLFQKYVKIDKYNRGMLLHYPYSLQNISNTLANFVGATFVFMILVMLLLLALTQFVMLLIERTFSILNKPLEKGDLHLIDYLTESYAIPLGLLGTIISIWYSLEVTNQYISNYTELVEIIKIAIFTSVLGVSSTLMLEARNTLLVEPSNKSNKITK